MNSKQSKLVRRYAVIQSMLRYPELSQNKQALSVICDKSYRTMIEQYKKSNKKQKETLIAFMRDVISKASTTLLP